MAFCKRTYFPCHLSHIFSNCVQCCGEKFAQVLHSLFPFHNFSPKFSHNRTNFHSLVKFSASSLAFLLLSYKNTFLSELALVLIIKSEKTNRNGSTVSSLEMVFGNSMKSNVQRACHELAASLAGSNRIGWWRAIDVFSERGSGGNSLGN